jgi:hypothetical protein
MSFNRDLLRTVGGILVIGLIVVGTFLYGNQQRQDQIRKEQDLKKQQEEQTKAAEPASNPVATTSGEQTTGSNLNQQQQTTPNQAGVGGGNLPTSTPQTGGSTGYLVAGAAIVGLVEYQRQTRRALKTSILSR